MIMFNQLCDAVRRGGASVRRGACGMDTYACEGGVDRSNQEGACGGSWVVLLVVRALESRSGFWCPTIGANVWSTPREITPSWPMPNPRATTRRLRGRVPTRRARMCRKSFCSETALPSKVLRQKRKAGACTLPITTFAERMCTTVVLAGTRHVGLSQRCRMCFQGSYARTCAS